MEGCSGAGGSSCCVLDYQHSTEGGVRSGAQHPGSVLLLDLLNDLFDAMWKIGGLVLRTLFYILTETPSQKLAQVCGTF